MAFKDILLTLTSYPDPTPASVAGNDDGSAPSRRGPEP